MGAHPSFIEALDLSGKQITKVFAGMPADSWDKKPIPQAMSPRETAEHLANCYEACMVTAKGGTWDWAAPYSLGITEPDALLAKVKELREVARNFVAESDDPKVWHCGTDFLTLHDAYHVGQMCTFRLITEPEWDFYSIYAPD